MYSLIRSLIQQTIVSVSCWEADHQSLGSWICIFQVSRTCEVCTSRTIDVVYLLNVIGQAIYPHTVAAWLIPCCCCPPHWRALLFTRCCWLTIVHYVWCLWLLSSLLTLIDCAMIDSDLCTHSLCKMPAYRCLPCADVCVR